jgi:hypothetical protein
MGHLFLSFFLELPKISDRSAEDLSAWLSFFSPSSGSGTLYIDDASRFY